MSIFYMSNTMFLNVQRFNTFLGSFLSWTLTPYEILRFHISPTAHPKQRTRSLSGCFFCSFRCSFLLRWVLWRPVISLTWLHPADKGWCVWCGVCGVCVCVCVQPAVQQSAASHLRHLQTTQHNTASATQLQSVFVSRFLFFSILSYVDLCMIVLEF